MGKKRLASCTFTFKRENAIIVYSIHDKKDKYKREHLLDLSRVLVLLFGVIGGGIECELADMMALK